MPTNIDELSAVDRNKYADAVAAAAPNMTQAELKKTIATLTATLHNSPTIKAAKAKERHEMLIGNINATRSAPYVRQTMTVIDGALKRAGLPPFEDLATKTAHEIRSILASEAKKIQTHQRGAMNREHFDKLKSVLSKIGSLA